MTKAATSNFPSHLARHGIRQVLWLVLPVFLGMQLPFFAGVSLALLVAATLVLSARRQNAGMAAGLHRFQVGLIIGLALSLMWLLSPYWNLVATLLALMLGLAAEQALANRHGLSRAARGSDPPARGLSAWGREWLMETPEGAPVRVLAVGEIAMGGPVVCDYLFPDGVLLTGLGSSALFSANGRYFAAPCPSRQDWGLVILDRRKRRLYRSENTWFWELDELTTDTLRGRYSPLVEDQHVSELLPVLLDDAEVIDLVPVRDLWLTPEWQARTRPESRPLPPAPAGSHQVLARRFLPDSLRDQTSPLALLSHPIYALIVDGEPSGLLLREKVPVRWRADGQAFCCRAEAGPGKAPGIGTYWLWRADAGWRSLPRPWVAASDEPALRCGEPIALENEVLSIRASMDSPRLSQGRWGYRLHATPGSFDIITGHDPDGRAQVGSCSGTPLRLILPLRRRGGRGSAIVESAPLGSGQSARFQWHSDHADRGLYGCHIGDWLLPGEWLLDHRLSDCGRYLALIPAPRPGLPPGEVVIADTHRRTLTHSPPLLVARLQDFRNGVLDLVVIRGHQESHLPGTALRRFRQAAPDPDQAAAFLQPKEGWDPFYQRCRFEMREEALHPLPDWRLVEQPQRAVADGDFIYPAPGGRDAAWLFGAEPEPGNALPYPHEPRRGGYLLTASDCALGNITPTMIWSADGRYLALTRLPEDRDESGRRCWYLLILEPAARRLHQMADPIGRLPLFTRFDESGLYLLTHQHDREVDGDSGQPLHLALDQLLALPETPLIHCDEGWLSPDQEANRALWRNQDRSALAPWATNNP